MPVYLRAVGIDDKDGWGAGNVKSLKNFIAGFLSPGGDEENKIIIQKLLIFLIGEELLTQQYT